MSVKIAGTGSYVPDAIVTNQHLKERLGCDSDWVVKRTGILERHHALPHQATSDLCYEAAWRCLDNAGVTALDIDLILVATFTPDMSIPSTACLLQDRLNSNANAMEIHAACSGLFTPLSRGCLYPYSASELALIVGGDCNSRVANPQDVKTYSAIWRCCRAVLLTRGGTQGLVSYTLGVDGGGGHLLSRPACGSRMPPSRELIEQGLHYMHMDDGQCFAGASTLCDSIQDVLGDSNLEPCDIDFYFPSGQYPHHQCGHDDAARSPGQRCATTSRNMATQRQSSIPLALDEARAKALSTPVNCSS